MSTIKPEIVEKAVAALRAEGLAERDGDGFIIENVYAHGAVHTALAAVADYLRAEGWDRGYVSGHSRAMRRMSDEPGVEPGVNPYREARDE